MKVLLFTQWFDPEPTFKGLAFARALRDIGHDVQVVTGFPNYPGGKLYPGYKLKLVDREVVDGIKIVRLPLYPSHDGSAVGRALNYISFALSIFLYGIFFARRVDVIYVYHPPLTVAIAGVIVGLVRRIPVVCDIQDMWPDTLRVTGMLNNRNVLNFIGGLCKWVYARSAAITVISPGFKRLLVERGVPEKKIYVIYNWCDAVALTVPESSEKNVAMRGRFNVVFAGNMGKAQALEKVLASAALVATKNAVVQFVFVGDGVELSHLKSIVSEKNLHNVLFLPRMPMAEIGQVLNAADVLLVHLRDDPLFAITIPSKTQAYMAVGKPILMAVSGDSADLVNLAGCGVIAKSEDVPGIANGILQLASLSASELSVMGRHGLEYYNRELSLSIGVRRFSDIFLMVKNRN